MTRPRGRQKARTRLSTNDNRWGVSGRGVRGGTSPLGSIKTGGAPPDAYQIIRVRVQPRASRDELAGWLEDTLRVRVTAPPLDGRANAAVRGLIARAAGVPPSAVGIIAGERGRDKLVSVAGLTFDALRARLV